MSPETPLSQMSTENLKQLRDELKRHRSPAGKSLPLHPNVTTGEVIELIAEAEEFLVTVRTALSQWLSNLNRLGADTLAHQEQRPRLAPDRWEDRDDRCDQNCRAGGQFRAD